MSAHTASKIMASIMYTRFNEAKCFISFNKCYISFLHHPHGYIDGKYGISSDNHSQVSPLGLLSACYLVLWMGMRRHGLVSVTETLSQASLVYKSGMDQSLLGIREAG